VDGRKAGRRLQGAERGEKQEGTEARKQSRWTRGVVNLTGWLAVNRRRNRARTGKRIVVPENGKRKEKARISECRSWAAVGGGEAIREAAGLFPANRLAGAGLSRASTLPPGDEQLRRPSCTQVDFTVVWEDAFAFTSSRCRGHACVFPSRHEPPHASRHPLNVALRVRPRVGVMQGTSGTYMLVTRLVGLVITFHHTGLRIALTQISRMVRVPYFYDGRFATRYLLTHRAVPEQRDIA
jgi:hypothetical protein